jgi:CheY-like chemotaxis protein
MNEHVRSVLLVEDDPNDQLLIKHAANRVGCGDTLHIVPDVPAAISYLRGSGEFTDRSRYPFPDYVITDLRLPGLDGFALLSVVKGNAAWETLPIIVLSSADNPRAVAEAYRLRAAAYFSKPHDLASLELLLRDIFSYWDRATTAGGYGPGDPPKKSIAA